MATLAQFIFLIPAFSTFRCLFIEIDLSGPDVVYGLRNVTSLDNDP